MQIERNSKETDSLCSSVVAGEQVGSCAKNDENKSEDEELIIDDDILSDSSESCEESAPDEEESSVRMISQNQDNALSAESEFELCNSPDVNSDMELVSENSYSSHSDEEVASDMSESNIPCNKELQNKNKVLNNPTDAPLYVIPSSNSTYEAPVSYKEHMLSVCAYVSRHNCSDTEFKDLLNLLNIHLPAHNLIETDVAKVKAMCGFDKNFVTYHFYCNVCKKVYREDIDRCLTNGCSGDQELNKNYFITGNLDRQLSDVLARPGAWQSIVDQFDVSSNSVTDITSGTEYYALKERGKFLNQKNHITLSLFTDGIPLFKSSGTSLWPVYLLINELPRKKRFLRKNMILWGVWQGAGKPNMTMFLTPLVQDLNKLYSQGMKLIIDNQEILCKAKLVVVTMDLQARASVLHMTQHNGEFPCNFCMESGEVVTSLSGKGHNRAFGYKEIGSQTRTDENIRQDSKQAQQQKVRIHGFTGESVLLYLHDFSLVTNVTIDYMHGILLGVTKKLLTIWTDTRNSAETFYIGKHVKNIDKLLKNICPPYLISRLPRKLSLMAHWKASELRAWLLFYGIPCLKGKLENTHLIHFSTLVEATYILLGEGITESDLQRAHSLLCGFVKHTEKLYGKATMGLNFHNLTHLVACVKKWGPLWAWSCFCFESFNGELKKSVHGTGNVCKQIFWSMQVQKKVETENTKEEGRCSEFMKAMTDSNAHSNYEEFYQCLIPESRKLDCDLDATLKNRLALLNEIYTASDYEKSQKIIRNGYQMYSKSCSRVKRRNSHTIQLTSTYGNGARAIEVDYYLVNKSTRHVFAVGRMLKAVHGILPNRVPHLQIFEYCT